MGASVDFCPAAPDASRFLQERRSLSLELSDTKIYALGIGGPDPAHYWPCFWHGR